MNEVIHKHISKTALPRTGKVLDAINKANTVFSHSSSGGGSGGVTSHGQLLNIVNIEDGYSAESKEVHLTGEYADHLKRLSTIEVLKSTEPTSSATEKNVFSGLASLLHFLRRDAEDTAEEHLTFKKGIKVIGLTETQALVFKEYVSSELFIPGFDGTGLKLYKGENGDWNIEADNITVRKAINAFELIINSIRSVKGALVISQANGKIKAIQDLGLYYQISFEEEHHSFQAGDLIRHKIFNGSNGIDYWVTIARLEGNDIIVAKSEFTTSQPAVGDEVVQMGNTVNAARQSLIYLSAGEDGRPVIDVLEGVNSKSFENKLKTRLGNLNGITDVAFPDDYQPSGRGLYSENSFLKGVFVLRNGKNVQSEIEAAQEKAQQATEKAIKAAEDAATASTKAQTAKDAADAATTRLNTWASDGYISPSEKLALKQEQNNIRAEKNEIVADATKYSVSSTAYVTAFNTYDADLTYYTTSTPENIAVKADFATHQTAYYNARTSLLNSISAAAKKIAEDAATAASNANASAQQAIKDAAAAAAAAAAADSKAQTAKDRLDTWASDGYISPSEKLALKQEQKQLEAEKTSIVADAAKYNVSSTAYVTAYNNYNAELTHHTTATPENIAVRSSFATAQTAYYTAQKDILNAISTAAKNFVTTETGKISTHVDTQFTVLDGKITASVKTSKEYTDSIAGEIGTRLTNTETSINLLEKDIELKASQEEVNDIDKRLSEAEVKISPDNIQAMVKEEVNKNKIGQGVNLIPDSAFEYNILKFDFGERQAAPFDLGLNAAIGNYVWFTQSYSANADVYFFAEPEIIIKPNTKYTLSVYYICAGSFGGHSSWSEIRDSNHSTIQFIPLYTDGQGHNNKTWRRVNATFTTLSNAAYFKIRLGFRTSSGGWMAFDGLKLEQGNLTDWTPSPNDEVSAEQLLDTGIDISRRQIQLIADKTVFKSNDGTEIAKFMMEGGVPIIKGNTIYADSLISRKLVTSNSGNRIEIEPNDSSTQIKAIDANGKTVIIAGFERDTGTGQYVPIVNLIRYNGNTIEGESRIGTDGISIKSKLANGVTQIMNIGRSSTGRAMTMSGFGLASDVFSGEVYVTPDGALRVK